MTKEVDGSDGVFEAEKSEERRSVERSRKSRDERI